MLRLRLQILRARVHGLPNHCLFLNVASPAAAGAAKALAVLGTPAVLLSPRNFRATAVFSESTDLRDEVHTARAHTRPLRNIRSVLHIISNLETMHD